MSHDEIGNEDGTRFIPKYLVRHLDLFNKVDGNNDSKKGQNAAHLAQRLAELEHYFIEHCKDQESDMRKLYEAIGLLMDRTKPSKIGFNVNDKKND